MMRSSVFRRRRTPTIGALAWLACLPLGCSNGSDREQIIEDAGPIGPAPPLPSTCAEPPAPAALGHEVVVGDGTAASCTNAALQAAVSGGGDIRFDCGPDPITIPISTEVRIEADAIIDGGGLVTLDGGGTTRLLLATQGVHLAVKRLAFAHGFALPTDGDRASGGAIRGGWSGSLDIRDCSFADNEAGTSGEEGGGAVYTPSATTMTIVRSSFDRNRGGLGGAVHNLLSVLTIVDSTFTENLSTTGAGGAVYTDGGSTYTDDAIGGTMELCGCSFAQNQGIGEGGAAFLFAYPPDELVVNQCAFTDNVVSRNSDGGGLGGALRPGNATLNLANSLFARNQAATHGGGIWVDGNLPSYVTSCTFVDNQAGVQGVADAGYGGAISGSKLLMTNLTLVGNLAIYAGGAIFNEDDGVSTLDDSILSNNTAQNQWGLSQSCQNPLTGAHNLQFPDPAQGSGSDIACTAGILVADPLLGTLADNGGPTETVALEAGSPAIDAGEGCPELDQRGLPRKGACDLGAFELQ
jgi:hypothetical protein